MDYAIVTGSTSGIGFTVAERLLADGLFVYMNYANNEENAKRTAQHLSAYEDRFKIIRADLSNIDGVHRFVEEIKNHADKIKYTILNCGITDRTPFGEITYENWQRVMDANVNMPFFILQNIYDTMQENGSIVCISSLLATHPHAISISYGVSKAALSALCRNMVKFFAEKKIRINALEPGFIDTPWQLEKPADQRKRIENKIALGRFGQPSEVADICLELLKNTYINGAVVPVCGGYDLT